MREHQAAAPRRVIEAPIAGNLHGQWDPERIAQVASNLIGNAMKHGDPDSAGRKLRLTVHWRDSVTLTVQNGGTIAPDMVAGLFDPFRGSQRAPGRGEGLGLGLYIVSQIVQAHGGTVEVQTGNDHLTAFRICVPREEVAGGLG